MAKIITPMRAVMGRATVRFPRRSATRPIERRETAAEALRMESCRGGKFSGKVEKAWRKGEKVENGKRKSDALRR
jgi:hypothetical protein